MVLKVAGGGGGVAGGVIYSGTWDAATNNPTLTSGVGTKGEYYVVSVPGSTNLNGITDWQIGDWAIFNGTVWQKVDNSEVAYVSNVATGTGLTGVQLPVQALFQLPIQPLRLVIMDQLHKCQHLLLMHKVN